MKYLFSLTLYRLITLILSPVLYLALIIRSKNQPAYRLRIAERFGFYKQPLKQNGIVIHGASVGEVIALNAFINKTIAQFPQLPITITTFTPTGSEQVQKHFSQQLANGAIQHCYLPLDNVLSNALFLRKLKPQAMVFMETELWPSLIAQCAKRRIKLLLINGRLSPNSVKSYRKVAWLITPTLRHFSKILTQSQPNQDNFIQLGANKNSNNEHSQYLRCELAGNLKYDIHINQSTIDKQQQLQAYLPQPRDVWVIASTHQGDEALAINTFEQLRLQFPQLLLAIIPRHPERFDSVAYLCEQQGLQVARRSKYQQVSHQHQVWLIDTLGELLAATSLANVVTMGGSFSDIGGHNPLEPALFKKPVVVGSDMHNFTEVAQQLQDANGLVQLAPSTDFAQSVDQLTAAVSELLASPQKQQELGNNAYKVVLQNQGASDKSLAALVALLT